MYEYASFEYGVELVKFLNKVGIKKENIISIIVKNGYYCLIYKI